MFTYTDGDTYSSLNDETGYTPIFFNADLTIMFPDPLVRDQAQSACYQTGQTDPNPSLRRECYYDYAVLGEAVALATANNLQKVTDAQSVLGMNKPNKSLMLKQTVIY